MRFLWLFFLLMKVHRKKFGRYFDMLPFEENNIPALQLIDRQYGVPEVIESGRVEMRIIVL